MEYRRRATSKERGPTAAMAGSAGYGAGMSQHDFMARDECLVVNYNDEVIGADNKYNAHKFVSGQPKGIVHRAFSVMLFDSEGQMLLQQRAASKVTFPRVWTNTCCSHPLHGQTPDEIDPPRDNSDAEPIGIFNAAWRKLRHELGIEPSQLVGATFKYMGRVHYWAADVRTHGPSAPWGEHEIDYLLLVRLPPGQFTFTPNPDEVMDTAWVSAPGLAEWMASPRDLWSPWFRVIARERLFGWWADLDKAMNLPPEKPILRFDPPPEYRKGGGSHSDRAATELGDLMKLESAFTWDSPDRRALTLSTEREARRYDLTSRSRSKALAAANKQGGYGKVGTHQASKLNQLLRVDEVFAALWLKFGSRALASNLSLPDAGGHASGTTADLLFCDRILGQVSRSFAAVIRQLPREMVLDILLFYLILRALDTIEVRLPAHTAFTPHSHPVHTLFTPHSHPTHTVSIPHSQDDMQAFKTDGSVKCTHLRAFADDYLHSHSIHTLFTLIHTPFTPYSQDDMQAFKTDESVKCAHLRAFADDYLGNEGWSPHAIHTQCMRPVHRTTCRLSRPTRA
jgi:isopentenyl-diphosphate delta-isomerase